VCGRKRQGLANLAGTLGSAVREALAQIWASSFGWSARSPGIMGQGIEHARSKAFLYAHTMILYYTRPSTLPHTTILIHVVPVEYRIWSVTVHKRAFIISSLLLIPTSFRLKLNSGSSCPARGTPPLSETAWRVPSVLSAHGLCFPRFSTFKLNCETPGSFALFVLA